MLFINVFVLTHSKGGGDSFTCTPAEVFLPVELGVLLQVPPDGLAHHGVLAHQHNSLTTEGDTDFLK